MRVARFLFPCTQVDYVANLHPKTAKKGITGITCAVLSVQAEMPLLCARFRYHRTRVQIQKAERALMRREHELGVEPDNSVECEAIINALHCLEALRIVRGYTVRSESYKPAGHRRWSAKVFSIFV